MFIARLFPALRRWPIKTRYGPLVCDLSENVCLPLVMNGEYSHWRDEEPSLEALPLTDQSVVVDIGANIGVLTAWFARRAHEVHAFEPAPRALELLRMNAPSNATIHPLALGEESGLVRFTQAESLDMSAISDSGIEVEIRTLDSYGLAPDLIKIDVEGFEPQVLRGARQTIARHRPLIMFEALSPDALAECVAIIESIDPSYQVEAMGGRLNHLARHSAA